MTQQQSLPEAFTKTFLSARTVGQQSFPELLGPDAEQEAPDKRRLSLKELHGCATAAVTYGDAQINLEALQDADKFATYFKCIGIGHYLLTDDNGAVFNLSHRKSDDKWSLLTSRYGWINQEIINRKLSLQTAAA